MRANVVIDPVSVDQAGQILGTSSRSETIRVAVAEVVRRERLRERAEASVEYRHIDPEILARVNELAWK